MKKQNEIPTEKLSMVKQHWMPIAIVVGFAMVLPLVVRYDVLYEQESVQPHKMTPEEREVLRKKEKVYDTEKHSCLSNFKKKPQTGIETARRMEGELPLEANARRRA